MAKLDKDSLDLAAMHDTLESPGYRLIVEKQKTQVAELLKALMTAKTWDETRFIQGQLNAIQRNLELPAIIEKEIRGKQRRAGIMIEDES